MNNFRCFCGHLAKAHSPLKEIYIENIEYRREDDGAEFTKIEGGEKVEIRGFCRFTVRKRNSFISWNPKSGQKVKIPPNKLPYFRAGKDLKEMVDYEKNGSINLTNINNSNTNSIILRSLYDQERTN